METISPLMRSPFFSHTVSASAGEVVKIVRQNKKARGKETVLAGKNKTGLLKGLFSLTGPG